MADKPCTEKSIYVTVFPSLEVYGIPSLVCLFKVMQKKNEGSQRGAQEPLKGPCIC